MQYPNVELEVISASPPYMMEHHSSAPPVPVSQQPHVDYVISSPDQDSHMMNSSSQLNQSPDGRSFLNGPIRSMNGHKNRRFLDPEAHGILPTFHTGDSNMFVPHLSDRERVFGSFQSEMYETSIDRKGWFTLLWSVLGFFLPTYTMFSLFVTSEKIVTCEYKIHKVLEHEIDRQDSQLKNLLSVQIEPSTRGKFLYRAKQFYCLGGHNMWLIKFFDSWLTLSILFLFVCAVPFPCAYLPLQVIHSISTVPLIVLMFLQALRIRLTKGHEVKLQRLYKDVLCVLLWFITLVCSVAIYVYVIVRAKQDKDNEYRHENYGEERKQYWVSLDFYYYIMFGIQLVSYILAMAIFFPRFGSAMFARLTLKFKGKINHEIFMTYQDCMEAKRSIEEALNYTSE